MFSPGQVTDLRLADFACDACRPLIHDVLAALEQGRGYAVIDGLPAERYTFDESQALYWLVGQLLAEPFTQNVEGTLLYDVRDTGRDVAEGARFSVTNYESSFHTDNSFGSDVLDYVGLLCWQTAKSGGMSQVVSGFAVCRALEEEFPQALAVLQQPFHVDRRGGLRPGETATAYFPIIERQRGDLLLRYLRYWIEDGHQKIGQPLSAGQKQALDQFDAVANRRELRVEFMLQPGQMFFINNRWILHNRTAFEDHAELERRRHYVRLWLRAR